MVGGVVGQGEEVVVAEEDAQRQVAADDVAEVVADLPGVHVVEDVGHQDDQRPLPAPPLQLDERPVVAGLDQLGEDVVDGVDQPVDPPRAAAGGDVGPDPVGVGEQADLVAPEQGDVGEHQHGVEGVVERREPAAGVAGHHPAAVDQEDDPLALVGLVGPDGELPPAGGRLPVEVAGLVPLGVVAEPLELVVGPQPPRPPDARCALSLSRRASRVYRAIWRMSG